MQLSLSWWLKWNSKALLCTATVASVQTASGFVLQVEEVTPDVPLPGLKQKGKEAEAIGKWRGPNLALVQLIRW